MGSKLALGSKLGSMFVSVGVRVRGCMVMRVRVDGMDSAVRVWSRVVRVLSRVGRG